MKPPATDKAGGIDPTVLVLDGNTSLINNTAMSYGGAIYVTQANVLLEQALLQGLQQIKGTHP